MFMNSELTSPTVSPNARDLVNYNRIFKDINESGLDQTQILFDNTNIGTMSFDSRNTETKWTSHMSNN